MEHFGLGNWIKLTVLGVIWGASFMCMSVALTDAGPLFVAAARLVLGATVLVAASFALGSGLPPLRGPGTARLWIFVVGMALFTNAVPFSLLAWAQQVVPSGFAGVCMAAVPLIMLPLAFLFLPSEKITLRRIIGLVIGTIGVIVLIGPSAFAVIEADTWTATLARLACLLAATCYAIGSVLTRLAPETNRLSLAAAVLLVAAMMAMPNALLREGWPDAVSWRSALALLYLGLFPTGLAQVLLMQVIRDAGPVFMSLVNYQVPLWSVAFGSLILHEPLPATLFAALALILIGMGTSQSGELKRLFSRRRGRAGRMPPIS